MESFLYEVIFVPENILPPPREIIFQSELQIYIKNFGEGVADFCFVTEIDDKMPSLASSVLKNCRQLVKRVKFLKNKFLSMFADGINQSMLPILRVFYGEKDYKSIRMLMRYVWVFLMKIFGASVIVAMIFPQELLMICKIPANSASQGANDVRLFSLSFFAWRGRLWWFTNIRRWEKARQEISVLMIYICRVCAKSNGQL